MATVTGKTSEKIDELLGQGVVSGSISGSGQLILRTRAGVDLSAGSVVDPDAIVSGSISSSGRLTLRTRAGLDLDAGQVPGALAAYPVGALYFGTTSANPATLLGGGNWVRFGQGKVVIGVDESDTQFATAELTGGEKAHTQTIAEMPNHGHTGTTGNNNVSHTHGLPIQYRLDNASSGGESRISDVNNAAPGGGTSVTANTLGQSANHVHPFTTANTGGGTPMPILPPFVTCYVWKRTA